MANTVTLNFSTAADNTTATITDATTYTSPTRATCGVFINVYKTDYEGAQTKLSTILDNSDANSTSTWTFNLDVDGWYQVYYFAPPDYASGTSYAKYAAVFDPGSQAVYRSKSNGNLGNSLSNTTYWEIISDPAILAENFGTSTASANTDSQVVNKIYSVNNQEIRDRYAVDIASDLCADCSLDKDINLFEVYDLFVEGLNHAEEYSEFLQGERIARRAEALNSNC